MSENNIKDNKNNNILENISNKKFEFSKLILIFETLLVAYVSYEVLEFVEMAIESEFTGSLPYLTTFITAVWTAYGASISFYQSKSGKENIEKIKNNYESCSSYGSIYNEDIDI